jgi:hypothetical protein
MSTERRSNEREHENAHLHDDSNRRPTAHLRLPHLGMSHQSRSDLFATDNDPPPTPPYRIDASKSQEVIDRAQPPDYQHEHKDSGKPHVRYPDEDGGALPRPIRPTPSRAMSSLSNAPSTVGSDYDDDFEEEYNWSDDDDLLEEEAKFERTTGQRKKVRTGCGFTR